MRYLILIFFLVFSCKSILTDCNQNKTILLEAGFIYKNIILDTLSFNVFKKNDTINYQYLTKTNKAHNNILIKKIEDNDSVFILNNKECKFISDVRFNINNQNIVVYKYLYDIENSIDEEAEYYFTKAHGIIISNPLSGVGKYIYDRKSYSSLQDSILNNKNKFKPSFNLKNKINN